MTFISKKKKKICTIGGNLVMLLCNKSCCQERANNGSVLWCGRLVDLGKKELSSALCL